MQINKSPLTKPSNDFPVYTELTNGYDVQGDDEFNDSDQGGAPRVNIEYIKTPTTVSWASTLTSGVALYNASSSVHFDLHNSEETELVIKVLELAGISTKQIDIAQYAGGVDNKSIQQEKA